MQVLIRYNLHTMIINLSEDIVVETVIYSSAIQYKIDDLVIDTAKAHFDVNIMH